MTDAWDEKPHHSDEKYWSWIGPDEEYGVADNFFVQKFVEDRDAWLVKVREYYDIYVRQYGSMTEHALGQQKKLESIKTIISRPHRQCDHGAMTAEIEKILGVE